MSAIPDATTSAFPGAGSKAYNKLQIGTRFDFSFKEKSMEGIIVALPNKNGSRGAEGDWFKVRMWDGARFFLCFEPSAFGENWTISGPEKIASAGRFPGRPADEAFWDEIWPKLEMEKQWRIVKGHRDSDKYFMPPDVVRQGGGSKFSLGGWEYLGPPRVKAKNRTHFFDSISQVLRHVHSNSKYSDVSSFVRPRSNHH